MYGQDHKEIIARLASLFPKAFFEDPKQRVPLKPNIVNDVERQGCNELIGADVSTAIDYYMSHIGYQICLSTPGKMRVNLDGDPTIRVTEPEARIAQQKVSEIKQVMKIKAPASPNVIEPTPDRVTVGRKAAILDQKRSALSPTELVANATKKLGRATTLLDSEDDEFKSMFVEKVLKEVKADIDAVLTRFRTEA